IEGTTATVRVPKGEHRLQALLGEVRVFDADAIGAARVALVSPGLWNVRCATSHPWEQAWIYVADSPYAGVSGADGHVRFSDVPAGSYTVKVWNPERGERTAEILVEVNKTVSATVRY
ncbi:MAG TPA: hypothetical protein VMV18_12215, partial [bacterium]|nr:hypothetical protein [bacterium]